MKIGFILFVIFASLFSACAAPNTTQPVDTIVSTTPEPAVPSTGGNPSGLQTYTDTLAGFSLDYPAGWFIEDSVLVHAEESSNYSISIASWDILNPPPDRQANGLPNGGAKFDVTVIKEPMTLEGAVAQVKQTGTPVLAQSDVTLANGIPGTILDIEGFAGRARMLIALLNGNVIYVTGYGNLENFETIALSLRNK